MASACFAISFTCGTLWIVNIKDVSNGILLGLSYLTDFIGMEVKPSCINTMDHLLLPWKQTISLHPSCFNEMSDDCPKVNEFLAFGDSLGNLVLYQNREPVFYEQYCFGQVCSLRFLKTSLVFAILTSEG